MHACKLTMTVTKACVSAENCPNLQNIANEKHYPTKGTNKKHHLCAKKKLMLALVWMLAVWCLPGTRTAQTLNANKEKDTYRNEMKDTLKYEMEMDGRITSTEKECRGISLLRAGSQPSKSPTRSTDMCQSMCQWWRQGRNRNAMLEVTWKLAQRSRHNHPYKTTIIQCAKIKV